MFDPWRQGRRAKEPGPMLKSQSKVDPEGLVEFSVVFTDR